MPLRETEGIVLRTYRLGEADKIVSLFTRSFGRVRVAATGAQRPKGRFGGVLEPLTHIRVWLFERENRELLRLNSAELLESFFVMQSEYSVQIAAQYLAEAAERFLPEREINERAFRLWIATLRALKSSGKADRPLIYFNYWLLRLSGFLPSLSECSSCGRDISGETIYYGRDVQGVYCLECRVKVKAGRSIPPPAVALLQYARRAPLSEWMDLAEPARGSFREARQLLETWVGARAEGRMATLELLSEGEVQPPL